MNDHSSRNVEGFKEHEDTSRLWLLALINTLDTKMLQKVLGKFIELRDNDPAETLRRLRKG